MRRPISDIGISRLRSADPFRDPKLSRYDAAYRAWRRRCRARRHGTRLVRDGVLARDQLKFWTQTEGG